MAAMGIADPTLIERLFYVDGKLSLAMIAKRTRKKVFIGAGLMTSTKNIF
jgi:hypothetical protein